MSDKNLKQKNEKLKKKLKKAKSKLAAQERRSEALTCWIAAEAEKLQELACKSEGAKQANTNK